MNKKDAKTLLDYHIWANHQVWQCAEYLSDAEFKRASDYSVGSLQEQMFHLMGGDWFTLTLLQGKPPNPQDPSAPKRAENLDRAVLRANWNVLEEALRATTENVADEQWNAVVDLPAGSDSTVSAPLWSLLVANMNHATNHRAQVLAHIHAFGGETVEQGFFFYMISGQDEAATLG